MHSPGGHGEGVQLRGAAGELLLANVWISCSGRVEAGSIRSEVFRDYAGGPHSDIMFDLGVGTMATCLGHLVVHRRFPPRAFQDTELWAPNFCTPAFK